MRKTLTKNVQDKIAFDIFATKWTHQQIADKFGVSRSLVTAIAAKYNLKRHKQKGMNGPGLIQKERKYADISAVNSKFDDKLIKERIISEIDNMSFLYFK